MKGSLIKNTLRLEKFVNGIATIKRDSVKIGLDWCKETNLDAILSCINHV